MRQKYYVCESVLKPDIMKSMNIRVFEAHTRKKNQDLSAFGYSRRVYLIFDKFKLQTKRN